MVQAFMASGPLALDEQLLNTGGLVPWFKVPSLLSVPSVRTLDEEATQALLQAHPDCFLIKSSGPTFFLPATMHYVVGASVEYSTQDNMHNASGLGVPRISRHTPGTLPCKLVPQVQRHDASEQHSRACWGPATSPAFLGHVISGGPCG